MGGYSGRDMIHDPVHLNPPTIQRTSSEDSRDEPHYIEDGRKHPDFRSPPPSQPMYSVPSSSSSRSTISPRPRGLSERGLVPPPILHERENEPMYSVPSSSSSRSTTSPRPRGLSERGFASPPIRHEREIEADPYERDRPPYEPHEPYIEPRHEAPYRTPDTYYIIPAGTNVIFQDENGKELTRVGDFSGRRRSRPRREKPLIVQDEFGNELYRTPGHGSRGGSSYGGGSDRVSYMDHYASSQGSQLSHMSSNGPNVILLDHSGRQIPLTNSSASGSTASGSYRGGGSYRSGSSHGSGRGPHEVVNNGIRTIHI